MRHRPPSPATICRRRCAQRRARSDRRRLDLLKSALADPQRCDHTLAWVIWSYRGDLVAIARTLNLVLQAHVHDSWEPFPPERVAAAAPAPTQTAPAPAPTPPAAPWTPTPEPAATAPVTPSAAFRTGHDDRVALQIWVDSTIGDYHDGAEYWASVRSVPDEAKLGCNPSGNATAGFVNGCQEAARRLAVFDRHRLSDPEYKAGWALASQEPAPPVIPSGDENRAFRIGRLDGLAYRTWAERLTGAYKDGSDYWASVRSVSAEANRGCNPSGKGSAAFIEGCRESARRLAVFDRLRLSDDDYRFGWNAAFDD